LVLKKKPEVNEIRKILKEIIEVGGKSFSNEDIRQLIDTDLFPDDDQFRKAVDVVKKEPEFKNLTFEKKPRPRLKNDPVSVLMAKTKERRDKKINILGSKDYEKELYKYKKEIQEALGLEKYKTSGSISGKPRELLPIEMGHQSSIKQLSLLKQKMRPEDLSPQNYEVNRKGVKKNKGGVQTLEDNLNKKFYPEQKKLYIQAKKFIDAGKTVPADLQNKIVSLNEDIQKFVDNTVKKYPLLKDRVNPITIDANDLTVKRGNNVFKQLGIGLVDQNLGDIKIGSIDDLTIKANLAQQTFKEAVDAGLIDEIEGQKKLNKFLNSRPILKDAINDAVGELACGDKLAGGGRIKFNSGSSCNVRGRKILTDAMKNGINSIEPSKQNLVKRIISGGNTILKNTGKFVTGALNPLDFFRLKNLIGLPAAIAAVGFDTVAIADDVLRKGQPFDVAAGNEFLTQFLDLNTSSKQAQRILDDKGSNLSPAAKEYAQLLVDWGKYKNILKEKNDISRAGNLETFEEDQAKLEKKLNILQEKISNFREDGALDYNAVVNELGINEEQSEYIGKPKKDLMFTYAADDTNTIPKYPFLTEDMGTGKSRSDGFYRNADGNRIKVNEYGYATKGNIFDIPGKTGARVDRKFPYGETDQGRNPALLTEGEKIFRAETKQPAKYQKPFTYKDFSYQNKALSDEQYNKALKYYRDQGFIKDDQRLEDVNIPKGYNKRIVNGKEYNPPKTFLQDVTEFFNIDDKWKQAIYQPGMLGTQDKLATGGRAGYSKGGITTLRSKYEYKK